jgi:hypothetical protein
MARDNCEIVSQILSSSPSILPKPVPLKTPSLRPPQLNSDSFYLKRIGARFPGNEGYQERPLSPPEILNIDFDIVQDPIRPLSTRPSPHEGWKWSSGVEAENFARAMVDLARRVEW